MAVMLPRELRDKLAALPEAGAGYQRVDLVLEDGGIIPHVMVFNGELADVAPCFAALRSADIVDVILSG